MPLLRRHRRLAAWVSLLALVLATLAPGIARAVAFAQGDATAWGQICSTEGTPSPEGGSSPAAHMLDHCPFCSLHGDTLGLPPSLSAQHSAPQPAYALPALFLKAPRTLHAWASAQPRAPPLSA